MEQIFAAFLVFSYYVVTGLGFEKIDKFYYLFYTIAALQG